jgi:hypothetical protein
MEVKGCYGKSIDAREVIDFYGKIVVVMKVNACYGLAMVYKTMFHTISKFMPF